MRFQRIGVATSLVLVSMLVTSAELSGAFARTSTVVCQAGWLTTRTGSAQGAAGTMYTTLTMQNRTGRACRLSGTPSAQPVFRSRSKLTRVGPLAQPMAFPGGGGTVVLKPHRFASVVIGVGDAGNYPAASCRPGRINGVVVVFRASVNRVRLVFTMPKTQVCTKLASTGISGIASGTKVP